MRRYEIVESNRLEKRLLQQCHCFFCCMACCSILLKLSIALGSSSLFFLGIINYLIVIRFCSSFKVEVIPSSLIKEVRTEHR